MDNEPEEMVVRNDYMWFLLLVLQSQKITMPFDRLPPAGKLRPLQQILVRLNFELNSKTVAKPLI